MPLVIHISAWGSPPHVRGKVSSGPSGLVVDRITPACAGKRPSCSSRAAGARDHPRICGEKYDVAVQKTDDEGSPPHMRGKGGRFAGLDHRFGITPAYAGKSTTPSSCFPAAKGSPPHMRGKGLAEAQEATRHRITPAYAGKSRNSSSVSSVKKDHPLICGEKWIYDDGKTVKLGITPAYAGKSHSWSDSGCPCWDHPRICGEKNDHLVVFKLTEGSPPHMRGKVHAVEALKHPGRITPAYAGKSST